MKYGESLFDIAYLLFAVIGGIVLLVKADGKIGKRMGKVTLVLGIGDAFHLVPRVINHFSSGDLAAALGIGKLITSVTMTVFYLFIYCIWLELYNEKENKKLTVTVWSLFALRVALCLLPQNGWLENDSGMLWGIIRNIPFVALGIIIIILFFRKRNDLKRFRFVWLLVTLSFVFYIPVAIGAGVVPMLGMLMLPKTVCYMLLIVIFLKYVLKNEEKPGYINQSEIRQ